MYRPGRTVGKVTEPVSVHGKSNTPLTPAQKLLTGSPVVASRAVTVTDPGGRSESSTTVVSLATTVTRSAVPALRPTTRGGHMAVYDAVRAQLDPPMGAQ